MKKAGLLFILLLIAVQAVAQSSGSQGLSQNRSDADAQAATEQYGALEARIYKEWYDTWQAKDMSKAIDLAIVYIEQYPQGVYTGYLRRWLSRSTGNSHGIASISQPTGGPGSESGISADYGSGVDGKATPPAAAAKPATGAPGLKDGKTILMQKVTGGDVRQVSELLSSHADVNAQETVYGRTALIYAVWGGNVEIIKALIAAGADVTMKDKKGRSAVEHAYLTENPEVIELFQKLE